MVFGVVKNLGYRVQRHFDNKQARNERRQFLVDEIVAATGMDRKKAEAGIDGAYAKGITYGEYMKHALYLSPEEDVGKAYEKALKKAKREQRAVTKHFREKIMEETGWDLETTKANVREARQRINCTTREYFIFKLFNVPADQQESFFLRHHSKQLMFQYNSSKKFLYIAERKDRNNEFFDEFIGRPWCLNVSVSRQEFIEKFQNSDRIIYKPLSGQMGRGIEVFDLVTVDAGRAYDEIAAYPAGVVEEYVKQHADLNRMCPASVNTLRVVTICSMKGPLYEGGPNAEVAYAALRIGGGTSVVDNFHSGGMVAGIDMATGTIITDGVDEDGRVFTHHPVTGTQIRGFQIPYFKEALDAVLSQVKEKKLEGYLGWDIAISETGPTLIETNTQPGVGLLQTPFAVEGKGMLHVMEKFLCWDRDYRDYQDK